MFVNFTNHPSGSWGAAQRRAAQVYGEILDLPFPDVPPALSVVAACSARCAASRTDADGCTHRQTEFRFVQFREYP